MADVSYVIDIAAGMPGGEATIAELDALTTGLTGAGKNAEFFQEAIKQVATQLDAAKVATASANSALADGQSHYDALEKAALAAAKAADKAAQKNEGVVPLELAQRVAATSSALDDYSGTLGALEQDAKRAADEEAHLAATLGNVKKLAGHVDKSLAGDAESTEKLKGSLAAIGGPLGKLGSKILGPVQGFQKLSAGMGEANATALIAAAGFAAVAVAIVAVTAAVVVGIAKVAAWAVGLADARREAGLTQQAAEAMDPALAGMHDQISSLSDAFGIAAPKLNGLTKQLEEAKVSAGDMPAALRAAAIAETALGEGGSKDFLARIKAGKVAVGDLSAEIESKLGGIAQKRLLGLNAQSERFHKNVSDLFGGLNIEPVLAGLQTLVGLFDKNTAAGQAMKFLFESVFQPLIDQAENAAYVIEAFALGFLIGLTKVYIAIKPAIKAVKDFLGFDDSSLTDTLDLAKSAGELIAPVFLVVVGIFGAVAAAVGVAIAQLFIIPAAFAAVVAGAVYLGVQLIKWVVGTWDQITAFFSSLNPATLGADLIQGLVDGITSAGPKVLNAITGVAHAAIDAAKRALGIASPSKVFAEIGVYTGEGFVSGVDDMTAAAQDSMAALVAPPAPTTLSASDALSGNLGAPGTYAGSASATAPGAGGGSGAGIDLSGATFNLYGVKDAADGAARIEEALTRILEGKAAQMGGAEATG